MTLVLGALAGRSLFADSVSAQIQIPFSKMCVQIQGASVQQQPCDKTKPAQRFTVPTSPASSFVMKSGAQCVQDNGGTLSPAACTNAANQAWTYKVACSNSFQIINVGSKLCLNVAYNSTAAGGTLITWACAENGANEHFALGLVPTVAAPVVASPAPAPSAATSGAPVTSAPPSSAPTSAPASALAAEIASPTFRNFPNSYLNLGVGQTETVGGVTLAVTSGGDVQITDARKNLLWHSNSSVSCGTCTLVMQGDGNLVLYAGSNGVWSTGTWGNRGAFVTLSSVPPYLSVRDGNFNVTWASSNVAGPSALTVASHVAASAVAARDFLDSLAVNSHVEQNGISAPDMLSMLNYLGVKTIRDGWNTSLTQTYTTLAKQGVRFDVGSGDPYAANAFAGLETIAAMAPGALLATEGPNEINNWSFVTNGVTSPHGWPNAAGPLVQSFMTKLFGTVHQNSKLAGTVVYDLTWGGTSDADKYGMFDIANQADFGNIHFYPAGQPYTSLQTSIAGAYHHVPPSRAVITEAGWDTANVSPAAQAILTLNLYLAAFQQGFAKTYVYELYDEWQTYGLFKNVSTPKPAATAIHNLTTILADAGSPTKLGTLNYSIPDLPATAHTVLLQKSNGAFDLIVWNEVPVYANGADVNVASVPLTVNFGTTAASVAVYDPVASANAVDTSIRVASANIALAGHALILEIKP